VFLSFGKRLRALVVQYYYSYLLPILKNLLAEGGIIVTIESYLLPILNNLLAQGWIVDASFHENFRSGGESGHTGETDGSERSVVEGTFNNTFNIQVGNKTLRIREIVRGRALDRWTKWPNRNISETYA
jgi:hypothetical protein